MSLSSSELERYERQMSISGWGAEGQKKLKSAKAAVVGIGGLGCPTSIYLTAVGVGRMILIDKGKFKLDNLNRQILCSQRDVGKFKAEVAKERLEALNSKIEIEAAVAEITKENADKVIKDVDVVVDGQDNWKTRFIINEYCVTQNIPFIHAGVSALHGQISTIMPGKGPCLRCIFPKDPSEVEKIPVLGATAASLASLQVMEAVKIITGIGKLLVGRMLFANGEEMVFDTVEVKRNMECPVCGNR